MTPESLTVPAPDEIREDPLVELCEDFDRRWSVGDSPKIEAYLAALPEQDRQAAFARLLSIELGHRTISGNTISDREYRDRFPGEGAALEQAFRRQEFLICGDSNSKSQNSTLIWDRIAEAVNPADVHQPHDLIDRYRLLQRIGRGGFGEVWRAIDTELHREVAIKLARSDRSMPDRLMELLRMEARHAASLRHSGIVPVYDIARTPRGTYIVSEFIQGETLANRLHHSALPRALAIKFAMQIAEALHHAHLRGLVHRDVKPGNILVRSTGEEALLTDFGLAVTEVEQLRETRSTVGTWWYMSPEQARGESNLVDARSDVYSLGVVLYQMLTNRLPFMADTREAYVEQVLHRLPRPLRTIDDSIDVELEQICLKCLAKDACERYGTAGDLAAALRHWSAPAGTPVTRSSTSPSARVVMFAGTALCLIALLFVGWRNWKPDPAESPPVKVPGKGEPSPVAAPIGGPAGIPVNRPDGWTSLFDKEPEVFFWPIAPGRGKPRFDREQSKYSIQSGVAQWLVTAGDIRSSNFEVQGAFSLKNWVGRAGIVWHLSHDPAPFPEKGIRTLALEYFRPSAEEPAKLWWSSLHFIEKAFDYRELVRYRTLDTLEVQRPVREWAALRIAVRGEDVRVFFDDEAEWAPRSIEPLPAIEGMFGRRVGLTGGPGELSVRDLSWRQLPE